MPIQMFQTMQDKQNKPITGYLPCCTHKKREGYSALSFCASIAHFMRTVRGDAIELILPFHKQNCHRQKRHAVRARHREEQSHL